MYFICIESGVGQLLWLASVCLAVCMRKDTLLLGPLSATMAGDEAVISACSMFAY